MVYKEELEQDLKYAMEQLKNKNSYRYRIYPWSNEHIENYYNYYNLTNKKVLCATGSGDHAVHSIDGGAIKIDCVDINPLSKYYQELKLAFMKIYNEATFWEQYSDKKHEVLSSTINIEELKNCLDENSYLFWHYLINQSEFKYNKYLFRFDGDPYQLNLDFEKIKNNIKNTEITYYDDDIRFFIKDIDIKYDVIFLSNILEWQRESCRQEIIENCFDILNPNGVIYDAICRREYGNTEIFENFETKIPTQFYRNSNDVKKGVYIYRKK